MVLLCKLSVRQGWCLTKTQELVRGQNQLEGKDVLKKQEVSKFFPFDKCPSQVIVTPADKNYTLLNRLYVSRAESIELGPQYKY